MLVIWRQSGWIPGSADLLTRSDLISVAANGSERICCGVVQVLAAQTAGWRPALELLPSFTVELLAPSEGAFGGGGEIGFGCSVLVLVQWEFKSRWFGSGSGKGGLNPKRWQKFCCFCIKEDEGALDAPTEVASSGCLISSPSPVVITHPAPAITPRSGHVRPDTFTFAFNVERVCSSRLSGCRPNSGIIR